MKFLSVKEFSEKLHVSERTIRNYCSQGRIPGARLSFGVWMIPEEAQLPERKNKNCNRNYLLERLRMEKGSHISGGIFHMMQIQFTYNSNHMEGSTLSEEQTRYIFDTNSVIVEDQEFIKTDDVIETINHFDCISRVIDFANYQLSEAFIKELHYILKRGTSSVRNHHCPLGEYKNLSNSVGGKETASPFEVPILMKKLLQEYNQKETHSFEEIIDFHYKFENIHPFFDGNGRVGRLIMLKECLKNNFVPILIKDEFKEFYYRGLKEYEKEKGYLIDACLHGQDIVSSYLDYFNIKH